MLLSAYAMLRLPTLTTQNPHKILNVILKRNTATRKDAMDNCIRNSKLQCTCGTTSNWPKPKYDVTQLPEYREAFKAYGSKKNYNMRSANAFSSMRSPKYLIYAECKNFKSMFEICGKQNFNICLECMTRRCQECLV